MPVKRLPPDLPITIPEVYDEFSSEKILVQSFESCSELESVEKFWPANAKRGATVFFSYLVDGLLRSGILHSDLHPKNYGFRTIANPVNGYSHELVLFDFGSVLRIEPQHQSYLYQLINAYVEDLEIVPLDALIALGFDGTKLKYISTKLPALCQKLSSPVLGLGNFDFNAWDLQQEFNDILGEDKWWFRTAGPLVLNADANHSRSSLFL